MPTAAEKEAKAAQQAIARQSITQGQGRLTELGDAGSAFPARRLRASGDLSRYSIGSFLDDPTMKPKPTQPIEKIRQPVQPKPKPRPVVQPKPKPPVAVVPKPKVPAPVKAAPAVGAAIGVGLGVIGGKPKPTTSGRIVTPRGNSVRLVDGKKKAGTVKIKPKDKGNGTVTTPRGNKVRLVGGKKKAGTVQIKKTTPTTNGVVKSSRGTSVRLVGGKKAVGTVKKGKAPIVKKRPTTRKPVARKPVVTRRVSRSTAPISSYARAE